MRRAGRGVVGRRGGDLGANCSPTGNEEETQKRRGAFVALAVALVLIVIVGLVVLAAVALYKRIRWAVG